MLNKVILIGNLTKDVELRYSTGGSAIGKLGLATNRKWKDKNSGETKDEAMFIDVTVFGRSAEIANQYLRKGSKILVEGRLQLERWVDNNGQNRSKHSVIAEQIQFLDGKEDGASYGNGGDYHQQNSNSYDNYNNGYDNNGGGNSYNNNNHSQQNSHNNKNSYQKPQQPSSPSMPNAPIEDDEIPF